MARVTVEDCVDKVPNRFELVLLSAQRARQISGGAELTIDRNRDKNPVVALREVADETVRPRDLEEALVSSLEAKGIKIEAPIRQVPNTKVKIAFLTDPFGTYIELTEGLAPPK